MTFTINYYFVDQNLLLRAFCSLIQIILGSASQHGTAASFHVLRNSAFTKLSNRIFWGTTCITKQKWKIKILPSFLICTSISLSCKLSIYYILAVLPNSVTKWTPTRSFYVTDSIILLQIIVRSLLALISRKHDALRYTIPFPVSTHWKTKFLWYRRLLVLRDCTSVSAVSA
jgi:hypothetical protein